MKHGLNGVIHNSARRWCQIDIKIFKELQFMKIFKIVRGFFLQWSSSSKIMQNVIFHLKP